MNNIRIWYDTFAYEFVDTRDDYAPPERYYEIIETVGLGDDTFQERFKNGNDNLIIPYQREDFQDKDKINYIRKSVADAYDFNLNGAIMVSWACPPKDFKEIVKMVKEQ